MPGLLTPQHLDQLHVLEQFEQACRGEQAPRLDLFCQQVRTRHPELLADAMPRLLCDLVALDIELRSRRTEDATPLLRLEDYVALLPELGPLQDLPLDLLREEYCARRRRGEQPTVDSYVVRFPNRSSEIRSALSEADQNLSNSGEATLRLTPPSGKANTALPAAPPGYDLLERIGEGGMGVVYKARQIRLNRLVALKIIRAGPHASEEDLARFQVEATAVARLQHPNITQVFEVGELNGRPYLALEFGEGGSLDKQLKGQPWPGREAAGLISTLAQAIHHAHEKGIVHRDLKPANVLLTGLTGSTGKGGSAEQVPAPPADSVLPVQKNHIPKISDFGLAKLLEDGPSGPTVTQAVLGTPSYMAPEQAAGHSRQVGPPADIYALGAILYQLLTGRPPFVGENPFDTLDQVRSTPPVPLTRLQPKLPRDLETITLKCLEKEPHKRYASAVALAEDLDRFLANVPIAARRTGAVERVWRWCRRHPRDAALLGTIAFVVVAAFAAILWQLERVDEQRQAVLVKNAELEEQRRTAAKQKKKHSNDLFDFYQRWWKAGFLENAHEATEIMRQMWEGDAYELYNVACQVAHLSKLVKEQSGPADFQKLSKSEQSAQDAVRILGESIRSGFLDQTDLVDKAGNPMPAFNQFLYDKDMIPLRERSDYKKVLRESRFKRDLIQEAEKLERGGLLPQVHDSSFLWAYLVYLTDVAEASPELLRERDEYVARAIQRLRRKPFTESQLASLRMEYRPLLIHPEGKKLLAEQGLSNPFSK
jgi:serine/threonine protein kinase